MKERGLKITTRAEMNGVENSSNFSGACFAIVLGEISPKVSTNPCGT